MKDKVKMRWELLRIYAELDEEYKHLTRQVGKAELSIMLQDFTPEQVRAIRSAINAHDAANRRVLQLACERMIFRSEIE